MTSLTRARTVLFIVLAVALAIPAVLFIDERTARWMSRLVSSVYPVSAARIAQVRNPLVFSALSFGWSLVVGIAIIAWMRAAYAFARQRLRVRDVEYRSWVFWSWMIPVINFYKPCQVLREIHRCGHPSAGKMPLSDLRSSAPLVLWWIVHRTLHFLFVLSVFLMVLSAVSRIPLSPFPSLLAQARWTGLIYVLLTLGWFVVAGALTARLRRHPAYAGEAFESEEDVDEAEEEEREQEAADWSDNDEQEKETRQAFFSSAYRREPQIGDLPEREEVNSTSGSTSAGMESIAPPVEHIAAPVAMPAAHRVTAPSVSQAARTSFPPRHTVQESKPAPAVSAVPPVSPLHPVPPPPVVHPVVSSPASTAPEDLSRDVSGFDEAAAYERIAEELETGKRDRGTWLRAVVESGTDEARQPVLYAQLRLRQLRQAHYKEIEDLAEQQRQEELERIANEQAAERRREAERYLLDAFHHQDALTLDGPSFLEVARAAADENRVNQRSRSNGKTLLHMAVERIAFHTRMADKDEPNAELLAYDRQAIRILLDAGADPGLRDRNARSAHDYARAVGLPLRQMV